MSIRPPPPAQKRSIAVDVLRPVDELQLLTPRRLRLEPLQAGPAGRLERLLDRPDPRRAFRMGPRVVTKRGAVVEEEAHGVRIRYPPLHSADVPSPPSPAPSGGGEPRYDVAVIGGGAAGLHVALEAAAEGARVALVSRKPLAESSSFWAQGGLAAAIAPDDSPARHAEDTINAGRGLCLESAVRRARRGGAGPGREARRARRRLRPQRERRARARPRGRALGPPDRPRRRRLDRQGDHPLPRRACRRATAGRAARGLLGNVAAPRCRRLPRGRHRPGPRARRGDGPRHRRRGRAVEPDDEPVGRRRRRLRRRGRGRAPSSAGSSSASSTRPRWRRPARRSTAG